MDRAVRRMHRVLVERNWIRNLHRHSPDAHRQSHLVERVHDIRIEACDRPWCQRQRAARSIRRADREPMVDEIELNGECPIAAMGIIAR